MDENQEISRIELLYQEDSALYNIEKKYNKLIKLKVEPYIDCIVNQYYLNVIGGDHYNRGIKYYIEKYIDKINENIQLLNNLQNTKILKDKLFKKKIISEKLKIKINDTYENYIEKSKSEKYSIQFDIYNFHCKQLETFKLINKKLDNKNHIDYLKNTKQTISEKLNNENNQLFVKLLESYLGVLEQQIDLLK
jgi:hypothetical protein